MQLRDWNKQQNNIQFLHETATYRQAANNTFTLCWGQPQSSVLHAINYVLVHCTKLTATYMYTAYRFKVQLCRLYIHNVHTWLVAIASPMPAQHRSLLEQTSLRSFDTNILIYKTQFRHCLYGTGPISQHAYSQLQAASLQFLCVHALYSPILCKYSNLLTRNINIKMLLKVVVSECPFAKVYTCENFPLYLATPRAH